MAKIPDSDQSQVAEEMERSLKQGDSLNAMKLWLKLRNSERIVQPIIHLQLARTLGNIGQLSEAIILCLQLLKSSDTRVALKAMVLLAVYWHRLGDNQLAIDLLKSVEHEQLDERYKVQWFSHLLSGFVGVDDEPSVQDHLNKYSSVFSGTLERGMQSENEIWKRLMPLTQRSFKNKKDVDLDDEVNVIESELKAMNQPATEPHVYYRIGRAYENFGNPIKADKYYEIAKEKSHKTGSYLPWMKSAIRQLKLKIDCTSPKKIRKDINNLKLAEKTIYFGLKLGIIYIDCQLNKHLLDIAQFFSLDEMIVSPKHIPSIHLLRDEEFETWCKKLLEEYSEEILLEKEVKVDILPDKESGVDLIARRYNTRHDLMYSIAIQCKGGKKPWTTEALAKELGKLSSCRALFKENNVTKFLWIFASGTPNDKNANVIAAAETCWNSGAVGTFGVIGAKQLTGYLYSNKSLEEFSNKLMLS